jgi:hypothetical protein
MTLQKVEVSERAIFLRLKRRLAKEGESLCTARLVRDGSRRYEDSNLGRYYSRDAIGNFIVRTHIDLESLGRDFGLIGDWEEVDQEA